jgi:plasmid stability protein
MGEMISVQALSRFNGHVATIAIRNFDARVKGSLQVRRAGRGSMRAEARSILIAVVSYAPNAEMFAIPGPQR